MLPVVARTTKDSVQAVHGAGVEPDWANYARQVTNRRSELGLTQEQIAAMGGPSTGTMRLIEAAGQDNYRSHTLYSLDRALGWSPGSHLGVLAGQEPRPLMAAEDFRAKISRPDLVAASQQDGRVYRRRDETALRDAVRELRQGAEQVARGSERLQQAAQLIAAELEADEE